MTESGVVYHHRGGKCMVRLCVAIASLRGKSILDVSTWSRFTSAEREKIENRSSDPNVYHDANAYHIRAAPCPNILNLVLLLLGDHAHLKGEDATRSE